MGAETTGNEPATKTGTEATRAVDTAFEKTMLESAAAEETALEAANAVHNSVNKVAGPASAANAAPLHAQPEHFPEVKVDGSGKVIVASPATPAAPAAQKSETIQVTDKTIAAPPVQTVATPAIQPAPVTTIVLPTTPQAVAADEIHAAPPPVKYKAEQNVCVRCGSTNLAKGYVVDYSDKFTHIHFSPKRMSPRRLNSITTLRPFRNLAKLDAVACRDCGAVLLVVEPGELRRAERKRSDY